MKDLDDLAREIKRWEEANRVFIDAMASAMEEYESAAKKRPERDGRTGHEAFPVDHAEELLRAEEEGRLVVFPCRVGSKVFVLTTDSPDGVEESKVRSIRIVRGSDRKPVAKCLVPCMIDDWGGAYREFLPNDFGVCIFLDRAEADAAAQAMSRKQTHEFLH